MCTQMNTPTEHSPSSSAYPNTIPVSRNMTGLSLDNHHDVSTPKRCPPPRCSSTIKFLCSYGGRILPRYPDGKLRYHGGETRVLAVKRSVSFAELMSKMGGLCATAISVSLRCKLPTEDLDALISITSDADLANLIEEYSHAISVSGLKIRAFLYLPNKRIFSSHPPSFHGTRIGFSPRFPKMAMQKPISYPLSVKKSTGKMPQQQNYGNYGSRSGHFYVVHSGSNSHSAITQSQNSIYL